MAVLYSALITAANVDAEGQDAFDFDIADADTLSALENIINQVTSMIEGANGLNRQLITRQYTHYFNYGDWDYDQSRELWFVPAPQWPIVEIDTSGFTAGVSKESFQNEADLILYTSRFSGAVTYYAGYKRSEQVLSDFNATDPPNLTDLATLPGDLPYDIRGVAINAALMMLAERRQGPGQRTKVMNPAVQTTTIQEPILDYIRRMVKERIHHHKKLA